MDKIEEEEKYKKRFINMQDPRDIVLHHPFNFEMKLEQIEGNEESGELNILSENDYKKLMEKIQ